MHSSARLGLFLLVTAACGAFASLLGPSELWAGVDWGLTGAAVMTLAIIGATWLFAAHGDDVFPEDMSIEERRAWIGIAFLGLVLANFANQLWALSTHGVVPESPHAMFSHDALLRVAGPLIAWGIVANLVGRAAGGVERDERDLRLRHRADRFGDWALTTIVTACVVLLSVVPAADLEWWLAPVVLANVLIGTLIVKVLVEHVALALAYRFDRA
jgi:membrane protein YdbS with pleckstrin-like domain